VDTGRTERRIIKVRVSRRWGPARIAGLLLLGNISEGGGHKMIGRRAGRKTRSGAGYSYIHAAVDDHSRLAYSEICTDEKKGTATGFWTRAQTFFGSCGITVSRVLTDKRFVLQVPRLARHPGRGRHRPQAHRPYRSQNNGTVECRNRTFFRRPPTSAAHGTRHIRSYR